MFINNGKSLFSNTQLIIAIIVLVIIMILSYNRCTKSLDTFTDSSNDETPEPSSVRINITGNNVILNFGVDLTKKLPKNFLVILVQYDSKMQSTGNNKFYLSNEYEINTAISNESSKNAENLCTLINGKPSCQYIFNNLDINDNSGNPYYYKIGICAIYDSGNSNFVIPYNINSANKLFTLVNTVEQQNNLFNEFLEYKKTQQQPLSSGSNITNSALLASADGQYELIKSQLGGYPSNLLLNDKSNVQNSLADIVDKSMALGILNINVKTPQTTAAN